MKFTYIKFILFALTLLLIGSCEKDRIPNNEGGCTKNCDTLPDELIHWESLFITQSNADLVEIFIGGPVIAGDQVVYVSRERDLPEQTEEVKFISYDRFNGEEKWKTTIPASEIGILISDMTAVGDQIIVFGEYLFVNINTTDGTVNAMRKTEDFPDNYSFKTVVKDQILFTSLSGDSDNSYTEVIACDLYFENWRTVTTIKENIPVGDNYLFFKGKNFYTNKDGDLIGIFMDKNLDKDIYQSTVLALNLSSGSTYNDRLLWKQQIQSHYDLTLFRSHNIYKDSLLIIVSKREIFGIELKTGIVSYKVGLDQSVGLDLFDFPISGNKTILDKIHLMTSVVDVRTGLETGTIDQVNIPYSGIVPYNGLFYFVNGQRLISLDPENLELVWNFTPQRRSAENYGNNFPHGDGLAIDPGNRLLYTTDTRYALCIDLPE